MTTRSIRIDSTASMIHIRTDWDDGSRSEALVSMEAVEHALGGYRIEDASRDGDSYTMRDLRVAVAEWRRDSRRSQYVDWSSVLIRAAEPSIDALRRAYGGGMNDDEHAARLRTVPDYGRINPQADGWDLAEQKLAPAPKNDEPRKRQIRLSREDIEKEETAQLLVEARDEWSFYDYKKHPLPSAKEVKAFARRLREFRVDDTCPIDAYLDAVQYVEEAEAALDNMERAMDMAQHRATLLEERVKELEAMLSKPKRIVRMR